MCIRDRVNDINRSAKSANPLTYFERYEMIRGAMQEFRVPESEYDVIPFPISCPEYILQYAPKEAVYYMGCLLYTSPRPHPAGRWQGACQNS